MLTFWTGFLGHIIPLATRPVIARSGTSVIVCTMYSTYIYYHISMSVWHIWGSVHTTKFYTSRDNEDAAHFKHESNLYGHAYKTSASTDSTQLYKHVFGIGSLLRQGTRIPHAKYSITQQTKTEEIGRKSPEYSWKLGGYQPEISYPFLVFPTNFQIFIRDQHFWTSGPLLTILHKK
jgi:hypothetical protein